MVRSVVNTYGLYYNSIDEILDICTNLLMINWLNMYIVYIKVHELSFVNKYKYIADITLETFMDYYHTSPQMRALPARGYDFLRNSAFCFAMIQ